MGPCLLSDEFGELYWKLLRLGCLIVWACVSEHVAVFIPLLYLHGSLQPIPLVVLVVNWLPGTDVLMIIESFAGGS